MSTFSLVLNSKNVVPNTNNSQYRYDFIGGNFKTNKARLCISQATVPYAWFNVSPQWTNQSLTFQWTVAGVLNSYVWTVPTGFYTTEDINSWLKQMMISIGAFLINASGEYVYYAAIVTNVSAYANQIILTKVPTSLPVGYTAPTLAVNGVDFLGYPTVSQTPALVFPATNSIGSILGFPATTYGPYLSSTSILSPNTPVATPVNSLIIHCSLAYNPVTMPSDILDSIPIEAVSFGSNINYSPSFQRWISINDGTYNSMIITLTDENNIPLVTQDNHLLLTFVLENGT